MMQIIPWQGIAITKRGPDDRPEPSSPVAMSVALILEADAVEEQGEGGVLATKIMGIIAIDHVGRLAVVEHSDNLHFGALVVHPNQPPKRLPDILTPRGPSRN